MAKYECKVCGYIYNEQHAGRPFEELTECPICNESKSNFFKLDSDGEGNVQQTNDVFFEEKEDTVEMSVEDNMIASDEPVAEEVKNTDESAMDTPEEKSEFVVERRQEFWSPVGNRQATILADSEEKEDVVDSSFNSRIESFYSSAEPVGMAHVISEEEEKEFKPLWNSTGGTVQRVIDPFGDRKEPVMKAENIDIMPAQEPVVEEILGEEFEAVYVVNQENTEGEAVENMFFAKADVTEEALEESIPEAATDDFEQETAETVIEATETVEETIEEPVVSAAEPAEENAEVQEAEPEYFLDEEEDDDDDFFSEVVMDQFMESEQMKEVFVTPAEEVVEEAEEVIVTPAEEVIEEMTEEPVAELFEEAVEEAAEEVNAISAEEVIEEVTEEPVAELFEETVEEIVEEAAEEVIVTPAEEVIEETTEEPVAELFAEAVEEAAEEVIVTPAEEVIEEVTEEPVAELFEEAVEETVEAAEEVIVAPTEEVIEEVAEETPRIKAWSFMDDIIGVGSVAGAGVAGAAVISGMAEEKAQETEVEEATKEVIAEEPVEKTEADESYDFFTEEIRRAREAGGYTPLRVGEIDLSEKYEEEEEEVPLAETVVEIPAAEDEKTEEVEYCNNLEKILILPAQLNPMPLPEAVEVEGKTVIGITSERPLVLDNPVFSTGAYNMVQYIPNSGLTSEDYQKADAIEIVVGKGNGIEKNINSKEDLRQVVNFLRLESDGCPIGIKLGAGRIERDLEFCIFAKPDYVVLNNFSVVPLPYALHRATKYLNTVQSDIDIVIALDGVKDAEELAKIIAMGADVIALRNHPTNMDDMIHELKNHARVTGHYEVQDLNVKDLCTTDREIAEYTDIYHV